MDRKLFTTILAVVALAPVAAIAQKRYLPADGKGEITQQEMAWLWEQPKDIASENLIFGVGGEAHQPHGPFTFEKEDMEGTNPKFDVHDSDGVKWKVKMGVEAQPEVAASRFVWAVGYHTDEDYFLPDIRVTGLPDHLHRGQDMVGPGGEIRNVRLKREQGEKKVGIWAWDHNPFVGTRALNGLRVMMAVIDNWDLKDENNAIRDEKQPDGSYKRVYEVSDLGASFGTTGIGLTHAESKGNITSYSNAKFITKVTPNHISFAVPSHPELIRLFNTPEFVNRMEMRWIGRDIPREDVRWIGDQLGQLSQEQITDAFRAAGYQDVEARAFAAIVAGRIQLLKGL